MRKRIKPAVLLVFFIGIISFLVLSRTIADLQARERQETTKTIPNSNTPRKTTTASSSSKKEEEQEIPTTEKEEIVRWVQNLSPEKAKSILNAMCDDNVTLNLLKKYVNK